MTDALWDAARQRCDLWKGAVKVSSPLSHTHTAAALARSHSLMQGFLGHFLSAFSFRFQLLCEIKMALVQETS